MQFISYTLQQVPITVQISKGNSLDDTKSNENHQNSAIAPCLFLKIVDHDAGQIYAGAFKCQFIEDMTKRTGAYQPFDIFCSLLHSTLYSLSFPKIEEAHLPANVCFLTYEELVILRRATDPNWNPQTQSPSYTSQAKKRYFILTLCTLNCGKVRYPFALNCIGSSPQKWQASTDPNRLIEDTEFIDRFGSTQASFESLMKLALHELRHRKESSSADQSLHLEPLLVKIHYLINGHFSNLKNSEDSADLKKELHAIKLSHAKEIQHLEEIVKSLEYEVSKALEREKELFLKLKFFQESDCLKDYDSDLPIEYIALNV